MQSYLERTKDLALASDSTTPLARPRSLPWIRILLTATAVLVFVMMALLDERPQLMLFGLAPLALIAGEAVWRMLKVFERKR
jgi:DMSO reductase anchor subunit